MKKYLLLLSCVIAVVLLPLFFGFFSEDSPKNSRDNVLDFRQWRKPVAPDYLYQLVDDHPEEKERLDSYFRVQKVFNLQPGNQKRVLAYSLFMKFAFQEYGEPVVNRESIYMKDCRYKGTSWYERYAERLISNIENVQVFYPNWIVRIYLSNDLAFLIDDVFSKYPYVEVFLMESSSIAHNPGAMWRFLVYDDKSVACAIIKDADESFFHSEKREKEFHVWMNDKTKHGWYRNNNFWRKYQRFEKFPYDSGVVYSPLVANTFAFKRSNDDFQMEKAMKGFILHRQLDPEEVRYCKDSAVPNHPYGFGNLFPNYGFDERFLGHVVYYYTADRGKLWTGGIIPNFSKINDISLDNPILSDVAYITNHCKESRIGLR